MAGILLKPPNLDTNFFCQKFKVSKEQLLASCAFGFHHALNLNGKLRKSREKLKVSAIPLGLLAENGSYRLVRTFVG